MKRVVPINRLKTTPITPERARELVDIIAGHFHDETSDALIELIAGVVDLDNSALDDSRADAALNALLQAFSYTTTHYNKFCEHLAVQGKERQRRDKS
jgi:hypothetical protein